MGDDPKWKRRLPSRIYNYNYNVAEGYYKPQTEFIKQKEYQSNLSTINSPTHQSYAERFSKYPWYGGIKGLPYTEAQAAGPLLKLGDRHWRTSSLLREMKELEEDGIPLALRASRRKKRYEAEEELAGIRKRASRNLSLEEEKYPRSRDMIAKDFHFQVEQKIKSLNAELVKSTKTASTYDLPKWNYALDHPSRQVKHSADYYSPVLSKYVIRNAPSDIVNNYSSSKPPVIPFRTRNISGSTEDSCPQPRVRINSIGDYSSLTRTSRRSSVTEQEVSLYSNRAPRLRESRRNREAQEFSDDVCKKVDMMRVKNVEVDPLVIYSHNRHPRSSSLDRIPRKRSSNTSRYVYGIGKI